MAHHEVELPGEKEEDPKTYMEMVAAVQADQEELDMIDWLRKAPQMITRISLDDLERICKIAAGCLGR